MSLLRLSSRAAWVLAGAMLVAGCKDNDEIRQYQAAVADPSGRPAPFWLPEYTPPAAWKKTFAGTGMSKFRETYQIEDGKDKKDKAELSITSLPGASDLLDNINRWAGKIGIDPFKEVPEKGSGSVLALHKLDVAKSKCDYVDLRGKTQRSLAILMHRPGYTWFFLLTGPTDLVTKNKERFEKFLDGVSFPDGQGK